MDNEAFPWGAFKKKNQQAPLIPGCEDPLDDETVGTRAASLFWRFIAGRFLYIRVINTIHSLW